MTTVPRIDARVIVLCLFAETRGIWSYLPGSGLIARPVK